MASFTLKSALIAMTMALTATATSQCNTNADCISGYICGVSEGSSDEPPVNVCVQLDSCINTPSSATLGPKCGDSIYCKVGDYCGGGYINLDGERDGALVCVNQATGVQCAAPSV
ncbi:hypothetical protein BGZ63DRAFT_415161 [Mariannaea sp. PMI_226]|nr:hypothetical protein BGZ63DRAFT_415161 [Mariannaea sp. PMI_226]